MRLTSEFWISALLRRVRGMDGYGYLVRRGSTEAGTIYLKIRNRDGLYDLYMPAPQTGYESERPEERMFTLYLQSVDEDTVNQRLEKELRFDPDLWLVEIEDCPQAGTLFQTLDPS